MRKSFRLGEIEPNPFRNIDAYPIKRDKVEALKESIRETGFWNNVVAREADDGTPQIAYGHHRLRALREVYDDDHEVELEVRDLSDEKMLQIMARENMEEFGTSAEIEMETVKAVVQAYGSGRISLRNPPKQVIARGDARVAPSFTSTSSLDEVEKSYTAASIADFLGWVSGNGKPQDKVHNSLNALELIERGVLDREDVLDLTSYELRQQVKEVRRTERQKKEAAERQRQKAQQAKQQEEEAETEAEKEQARLQRQQAEQKAEQYEEESEEAAREVGKELANRFRNEREEDNAKKARQVADQVRNDTRDEDEQTVHARRVIEQVNSQITRILTDDRSLRGKIEELIRLANEDMLTDQQREQVAANLERVAARALSLSAEIDTRERILDEGSALSRIENNLK